jgi:pyruvate ferredoxin oxidoreductase delta subunit
MTEIPTSSASEIEEPGSARRYSTGGWKLQHPVLDESRCTHCLICWFYCPDDAIQVEELRIQGFDLERCKGCGLCATVCPDRNRAIQMKAEPT